MIKKNEVMVFLTVFVVTVFVVTLFVANARAEQEPGRVAGTWHVAVRGWGIEDHLLVVQQDGGRLTGKFEFAEVKGTVTGDKITFDVTEANSGKTMMQFKGKVSRDKMKGAVTASKDSPILRHHGPGVSATTEWTATRETKGSDHPSSRDHK